LLAAEPGQNIRVIYNGIDLGQFQPRKRPQQVDTVVKILSVGNLVEPKGFEYLLLACKLLNTWGYSVRCEIIGGAVPGEMNYYIKLKKLHRALALRHVEFLRRRAFKYIMEKYQDAELFFLPAITASHGGRDITPNVL